MGWRAGVIAKKTATFAWSPKGRTNRVLGLEWLERNFESIPKTCRYHQNNHLALLVIVVLKASPASLSLMAYVPFNLGIFCFFFPHSAPPTRAPIYQPAIAQCITPYHQTGAKASQAEGPYWAVGKVCSGCSCRQGLGGKMIRTLRSRAKDTSAAATKDRCHLTKARVIDNEKVVHMMEEKEQKDVEYRH